MKSNFTSVVQYLVIEQQIPCTSEFLIEDWFQGPKIERNFRHDDYLKKDKDRLVYLRRLKRERCITVSAAIQLLRYRIKDSSKEPQGSLY